MSVGSLPRPSSQRRGRSRPLVALLVLISLTLLVVDQAGDAAPTRFIRTGIRDASGSVTHSFSDLWPFHDSGRVRTLEQQNAQLRQALDTAEGQAARAADAEQQRDALSALLALPTPNNVPKVIASVTAVGASNYDSTIELGKGTDSGIATGMPVVNNKGLIGRVVQTSRTRATVLLAIDTTSDVSVRFAGGDISVVVGGGMNKPMRVDLVDLSSSIQPGDVAVTSGEDHSIFPPGIPVGVVRSVTAGPQALRKDVEMDPIVNVGQLDNVAVLQWRP